MTERIITLRPHHIDRFVSFYYDRDFFDKPSSVRSQTMTEKYGEEFVSYYENLFNFLASGGTGEEYILIKSGLDDICRMCDIKSEHCSEPDSLSLWNGSGYVMQEMKLRVWFLYSLEDFIGRVKQLYPCRNPVGK